MLHSLVRSLGRSSHTAKRASRRNLSPSARRRPESAIERLEERMLLSAVPSRAFYGAAGSHPDSNQRPTVDSLEYVNRYFDRQGRTVIQTTGSDDDGDTLSYEIVSGPTVGELVRNYEGCYTLTAPEGFEGESSFSYRGFDGYEYSDVATVTVTFKKDKLPTLRNQTIVGTANQPIIGRIEWNDPEGDFMQVFPQRLPTAGTLYLNMSSGEFVYTPPKDFVGTESFTYYLDGHGRTNVHLISFVIGGSRSQSEEPLETTSTDEAASKIPIGTPNVDVLNYGWVFLPSTTSSGEFQPVRVTEVVLSTARKQANHALAESLRLTHIDARGPIKTESERPLGYEFRDVNGDGHQDLVAVFMLDWAELRTGRAFSYLAARVGWEHEHFPSDEPKGPKEPAGPKNGRPVPPQQSGHHPGSVPDVTVPTPEPALPPVVVQPPALALTPAVVLPSPVVPPPVVDSRHSTNETHPGNGAGRILLRDDVPVHAPARWSPTSQASSVSPSVLSTGDMNASGMMASSLSVARPSGSCDSHLGTDHLSVPRVELLDGDDDTQDAAAVFELDWAELWDGHESAVLTGRLV